MDTNKQKEIVKNINYKLSKLYIQLKKDKIIPIHSIEYLYLCDIVTAIKINVRDNYSYDYFIKFILSI
jgi:hypothetical protein